jgi:branched-chain amino acid transport system permease protein
LKALARVKTVRHPYILSLERYDIINGQLLIVMELADRNLWDRFKECRTQGMPGIPRESNFFWVYLAAFLTIVALYRLIYSSTGRALLALRDDEIAAESMGLNVARYKVVAFVISSFFAGIAGGLFAHYQGFIDPQSFNFSRSVDVVIMVVVGGMGSLTGALVGAIIVTVLPELLRVFNEYRMVIFPLLLILVMLLRPMGLLGHREIWHFVKLPGRKKGKE